MRLSIVMYELVIAAAWLFQNIEAYSEYCDNHEIDQEKESNTVPQGIVGSIPDSWGYKCPASVCERPHQNTFQVKEPFHMQLSSSSSTNNAISGVKFNVEDVPPPLPEDRNKTSIDREKYLNSIREKGSNAGLVYELEAVSLLDDTQNLVYEGGDGFYVAALMAFGHHLPLSLSPDHVWSVITYAFAKHVDLNAEALRKNFVQHEGKKRLFVETTSDFLMSDKDDPDKSGSSAQEWETLVFPQFSEQIRKYIGEEIHETIVGDYSTTTPTCQAANEIALMSAMKNYFSYGMGLTCGISNITLTGTENDWISVRNRAEKLGELMLPEFRDYWMPLLLPVLDEFVESYKGNINYGFWQSMVKLRETQMGSGDYSFISGWIQILFPYLATDKLNERLHPWQEMYFDGPEMEDFPSTQMKAPVDWTYFGETFELEFNAGIIGSYQNPKDGTMSPGIGWFVTHVHVAPKTRYGNIKREIYDLLEGHDEEIDFVEVMDEDSIEELGYIEDLDDLYYHFNGKHYQAFISLRMNIHDPSQPWFNRVMHLVDELVELDSAFCDEKDPQTKRYCIHPMSSDNVYR